MPHTGPEPLEADIGDFHNTYLHIPTSNLSLVSGSSTTPSSASPSLINLREEEALRDASQPQNGAQRKTSLGGHIVSPSSPSLVRTFSVADNPLRPAFARSLSLPRVVEAKQRKRLVDVDSLVVEPEAIQKLQRWIMGIAIGELFSRAKTRGFYYYWVL